MGSNKKDLEIIYNLQWKNSNGSDKSNIVGLYDTPATTLNWETFKSYLLKNSGAMVDDIRVWYVGTDNTEYAIDSQIQFQLALNSFRHRARNNDVITLKLDHIPGGKAPEKAPQWFETYMKEYKKAIVEEVTASVVSAMASLKLQTSGRKTKELTKRLRKSGEHEKDVRKSLKYERKPENQQDEKKIKEKKLGALLHRPVGSNLNDMETLMDATPTGPAEVVVNNATGGEIFHQQWVVTNTGSLPWTCETELRYAWGSEALKPIESRVPCPTLQPGEKGTVAVYLDIPSVAGKYECYWHFCHDGRRFGHWLGCHVNVRESPIKLLSVQRIDPVDNSVIVEPPTAVSWSSQMQKSLDEPTTLDELTVISESDNQSVVSVADSNSSVHSTQSDEEFVLIKAKAEDAGYAYINIDGVKQAVPKALLRKDFLEKAEEALPEDDKRLFVFPLSCPGFEVVYPPNTKEESTTLPEPIAEPEPTPPPAPAAIPVAQPPMYTLPSSANSPWYHSTAPFPPYGYTYVQPFQYDNFAEGGERPITPNAPQQVHLIPETFVSGAVNVASSAINTARSVLNMFSSQVLPMPAPPQSQPTPAASPPQTVPAPAQPIFVSPQPPAQEALDPRETALKTLQEMGFYNRDLNNVLLERFHNDVGRVITELLK